jgi:hypothetical protein
MATTYDYKCSENAEHRYAESRGVNDEQIQLTCVEKGCDGKLLRVYTSFPINFKGGGFSTKKDWR